MRPATLMAKFRSVGVLALALLCVIQANRDIGRDIGRSWSEVFDSHDIASSLAGLIVAAGIFWTLNPADGH